MKRFLFSMIAFLFLAFACPASSVYAESIEDVVNQCAQTEVYNSLLAPATSRLVSSQIIDNKGQWFIVYIVVDSQNQFGAYIRSGYLSCVKIIDNNKYQSYGYSTQETGQEALSDNLLGIYKSLIQWDDLN